MVLSFGLLELCPCTLEDASDDDIAAADDDDDDAAADDGFVAAVVISAEPLESSGRTFYTDIGDPIFDPCIITMA